MTRKLAIFIALILAVSLMLTACGGAPQTTPSGSGSEPAAPSGGGGEKVTLDVMHRFADEPFKGFLRALPRNGWIRTRTRRLT